MHETASAQNQDRPIESASASTAPQTNSSNFAYWLTAGVLGLSALIILAVAMLVYAAFATVFYSDHPAGAGAYHGNGYEEHWSDGADEGYLEDMFIG